MAFGHHNLSPTTTGPASHVMRPIQPPVAPDPQQPPVHQRVADAAQAAQAQLQQPPQQHQPQNQFGQMMGFQGNNDDFRNRMAMIQVFAKPQQFANNAASTITQQGGANSDLMNNWLTSQYLTKPTEMVSDVNQAWADFGNQFANMRQQQRFYDDRDKTRQNLKDILG